MSTLRQLLSWGSETLEKAEVPDSGQDAWMLMEEVFGIEKSYYFLHGTDKIDPDVQKRYEEMIRDRAKRIPVQYLTGKAWFMGYEFLVNSSVLNKTYYAGMSVIRCMYRKRLYFAELAGRM